MADPLLTTFTAPSGCLNSFHVDYNSPAIILGPPAPSVTSCFPSGWTEASNFYFSPGICPSGYVTACSSTNTFPASFETVVTCCPSGYLCQGSQSSQPYQWYSTYSCSSIVQDLLTTYGEYSSGILIGEQVMSPITTAYYGINAFSVQVRFQSTDFQTTSITTFTASTASITSARKTLPATVTVTTTGTPSSSGGSLSTGGRAGISVGVVIFVLALALLGALLYLRRRRQRVSTALRTDDTAAKPELEAGGVPQEVPAPFPYQQQNAMELVLPSVPNLANQPYMGLQYAPATAEMSAVQHAPFAVEMSAALHQDASELSGNLPDNR